LLVAQVVADIPCKVVVAVQVDLFSQKTMPLLLMSSMTLLLAPEAREAATILMGQMAQILYLM
jgi:hypothetical protein